MRHNRWLAAAVVPLVLVGCTSASARVSNKKVPIGAVPKVCRHTKPAPDGPCLSLAGWRIALKFAKANHWNHVGPNKWTGGGKLTFTGLTRIQGTNRVKLDYKITVPNPAVSPGGNSPRARMDCGWWEFWCQSPIDPHNPATWAFDHLLDNNVVNNYAIPCSNGSVKSLALTQWTVGASRLLAMLSVAARDPVAINPEGLAIGMFLSCGVGMLAQNVH